ncbi:SpoIIE family protein phosphatase [Streptomyces sannanensis]|uniref:SpoIIE family protein phosphatase n=1 Tax=Streptomyces sannanensis TaxID=285536 RepID=A0ABP6S5P2_9ACTN
MPDERTENNDVLQTTIDRLRAEVAGLRRAMATRGVIEQAKGLLSERLSCTPDEAFDHLVDLSHSADRKLVDVAADLLGTVAPPEAEPADEQQATPVAEPASASVVPPRPEPSYDRETAPPAALPETFAARYHLAASALSTVGTPDDLARVLCQVALSPLGVRAAVLALLEPDGALRLVGSHGVSRHQLSQWQRIPPYTSVPLTEAVQRGTAVWVADPEEFAARYPDLTGDDVVPGRTVCALPLRTGEQVIGAMKLGWTEETRLDPATLRYLSVLSRLCATHLLRVLSFDSGSQGSPLPSGEPWFRAVLDALLDPVLILTAVREPDGKVTDLRVEHANRATVDMAGRTGEDIIGWRVTELYPGMVAAGTFQSLLDVVASGVPYEGRAEQFIEVVGGTVHASTMTLHATPFLDGVLLSWRSHDEQERRDAQLAQAQYLARLGTWQWDASDAESLTCFGEIFSLLGVADACRTGTLTVADATEVIAPEDLPAVEALARRLLAGEPAGQVEFRVLPPGQPARIVQVVAETVPGGKGGIVTAIRGVLQDITAWRRTQHALVQTRTRLATEHRAVQALQQALIDVPRIPRGAGLELAVRYLPAETEADVGGDWYDALALPDGDVLIVVGDVSGHGLKAAAGMAQLRHALRGLAYTGAGPDEMLTRLNQLLCHQGGYIATAVCGRLDPVSRSLSWSRAGHLPPVLRRGRRTLLVAQPEGILLGASPGAAYGSAVLELEPEDTVVLYTDGLVERRDGDLDHGLRELVAAVDEYRGTGIEGCLDHVLSRLHAPNPLDDTCLLGIHLTGNGEEEQGHGP